MFYKKNKKKIHIVCRVDIIINISIKIQQTYSLILFQYTDTPAKNI